MGGNALIVLDTHAWIWWIDGSSQLSKRAGHVIDAAVGEGAVSASAISCWEIAMLARKGRLELTTSVEDWIARCEALPFFSVVPIDSRIATRAAGLPAIHEDPADRIIVATALTSGATFVTKDRRLAAFGVPTVW